MYYGTVRERGNTPWIMRLSGPMPDKDMLGYRMQLGPLQKIDIGKRVFLTRGNYYIENEEQRDQGRSAEFIERRSAREGISEGACNNGTRTWTPRTSSRHCIGAVAPQKWEIRHEHPRDQRRRDPPHDACFAQGDRLAGRSNRPWRERLFQDVA